MKRCVVLMMVGSLWSTALLAAPFVVVDQPTSTTIWGGPPGERQSQSFVAGPTTEFITAIEFQTWDPDPSASVTLTLRTFNSEGTNPDPLWEAGTLLVTVSNTFVGASDGDWLTFEFDTPVAVTTGASYTVFFSNTVGKAGYYRSVLDPYPGGGNKRVVDPPGGWDNVGFVSDLAFRVYGDNAPAVPVSPIQVALPGTIVMSFPAELEERLTEANYLLQATTNLVDSNSWENVVAITGNGNIMHLFDPAAVAGASPWKTYRIVKN
jgi:hypothetical protein